MFVVCCLLFVVCCLLFVLCCLLFVVCYSVAPRIPPGGINGMCLVVVVRVSFVAIWIYLKAVLGEPCGVGWSR